MCVINLARGWLYRWRIRWGCCGCRGASCSYWTRRSVQCRCTWRPYWQPLDYTPVPWLPTVSSRSWTTSASSRSRSRNSKLFTSTQPNTAASRRSYCSARVCNSSLFRVSVRSVGKCGSCAGSEFWPSRWLNTSLIQQLVDCYRTSRDSP